MEWLNALTTGTDFNLTQAIAGTVLSLVTSIALQAGLWAPLGTSEWAKSSGVKS